MDPPRIQAKAYAALRFPPPSRPPPLPRTRRRIPPVITPAPPTWRHLGPADLPKLKNLFFVARAVVEGAYAGRHRSPFKGSSPEFADYREYHPGDDPRTIDWKAFARTDRYFIKLFEKQTDMDCHLLVDCSASMAYGGAEYKGMLPDAAISKLDYAFHLAAALSFLMIKQGDKVSLGLFHERLSTFIPTGGTMPHLYKILTALEKQRAGHATSVARVLNEARQLYRRKGLLLIISDFLDEPAVIFQALNYFRHRRFEILLLHVLHRYERRLPPLDNVRFVDAESGRWLSARTADVRDAYHARIDAFIRQLATGARTRGIDHHLLDTGTPYFVGLERYLLRRGSR